MTAWLHVSDFGQRADTTFFVIINRKINDLIITIGFARFVAAYTVQIRFRLYIVL